MQRAPIMGIGSMRLTMRKRIQERRSGRLHGSVRGSSSRFRGKIRAVREGYRHRRR